jgi:hypothetical protein
MAAHRAGMQHGRGRDRPAHDVPFQATPYRLDLG